jgi:hypothetical protein
MGRVYRKGTKKRKEKKRKRIAAVGLDLNWEMWREMDGERKEVGSVRRFEIGPELLCQENMGVPRCLQPGRESSELDRNIGSGTWVAKIAPRLLFTSSEAEYESLVDDAFADLNALVEEGMTDKGPVDRFRAIFGNTAETSLATFRPQPLWIRAIWGVTTCSNRVERLHRELTSAVENVPSLFHRLGCIYQALVNRFEATCRMKHDQAMKLARRFSRIDGRKDVCAKVQAGLCGWSDIYSKHFGIPGFPCPHTVFDSQQLN